MIPPMRRREIYNEIQEKKSASVSSLAKQFSVTEETIRRDLKELESQGLVTRTYGGAFIQSGVENLVDITVRAGAYMASKQAIAESCLQFIHNGDTIFMDNSTTVYHLAKLLRKMHLTVLTNSLSIINLLASSDMIRLTSIGGSYSKSEKAFYGNVALRELNSYYVDSAFLSCRSLSLDNGVTDSTERWTVLRQKAIERSGKSYILADYTKFGRSSFLSVCGFDAIEAIITDKPQSDEWTSRLDDCDCSLIVSGETPSRSDTV